ncbi:hypothetical protein MMC06_000486 [Schaereria dolodes]|nr:hypothetical protein [Schaereria dolodes]
MTSISIYGYDSGMLDCESPEENIDPCEERKPLSGPESVSKCGFLQLPVELRGLIYGHLLPNTVKVGPRGIAWLRGTTSILATNKQIYSETSRIIYGDNTFVIDVLYDCSTFAYQWLLPSGLIPKRTMAFPDDFALQHISLMRKFHIQVHHLDDYTGMVKYGYGGHGLTDGTRDQVKFLCQTLRSLSLIRSLHIHFRDDSKSKTSKGTTHYVLEPFLDLKNTFEITTSGSINTHINDGFQSRLSNAFSRNSFLRLPPEIREKVYTHLLPYTISCTKRNMTRIQWQEGYTSIIYTNKLIHAEATRHLYSSNNFFIICGTKSHYFYVDWASEYGDMFPKQVLIPENIGQRNFNEIRHWTIKFPSKVDIRSDISFDEVDELMQRWIQPDYRVWTSQPYGRSRATLKMAVDGVGKLLRQCAKINSLTLVFRAWAEYGDRLEAAAASTLELKGIGNVEIQGVPVDVAGGFKVAMESD